MKEDKPLYEGRFGYDALARRDRTPNPHHGRLLDEPLYATAPSSGGDPRKTLHETLEILRRGKWVILGTFLLVLAAAIAYTYTQPLQYSARALMLLDAPQPQNEALTFGYVDGTQLDYPELSSQLTVLQESIALARRTAERLLELEVVPSTGKPISVIHPGGDTTQTLGVTELALKIQDGYVSVSPNEEESNAIWITARGGDPEEAALIANVYAEEAVERTRESGRQRITSSRRFLQNQLAKRRKELREAEDQVQAYTSREGAMALDHEAQSTVSQMAQLEATRDEILIEKDMARARLASLEEELQDISPKLAERAASAVEADLQLTQEKIAELEMMIEQIYMQNPELRDNPSASPELNGLVEQSEQLRARARDLSQRYVEESLDVGGVDPRGQGLGYVADLHRQIAAERIELSGLDAKEEALDRRLASHAEKIQTIPEQSTRLAQLERTREISERMYLYLTEKLQEAVIAEQSDIGTLQIVRPAFASFTPDAPKSTRAILLAVILGLFLGLGAAFARHKLDSRVYTPSDFGERDLDVLGVVPDLQPAIRGEFGVRQKVLIGEQGGSTSIPALHQPFSSASEAFRHLFVRLRLNEPGPSARTVLVTSPEAGAGKSTTAVNLAVTAARSNKRTLLLEADLRRPSVATLLGVTDGPELVDLLQDPQAHWSASRFTTDVDNLYALTARKPVANAAEWLASTEMRELLKQLSWAFDVIIVDTPPLLLASDALLLAPLCDVTAIVATAGRTSRDALEKVVRDLNNIGNAPTGVVLNRFNPAGMYAYKYTYQYASKNYDAYYGYQSA